MIYALTDYLDHLCDNWSGIVVNDYETVVPVPWRKKYGITYIYEVPFIQQLGTFSTSAQQSNNDIIDTLFSFCRYGRYHFNHLNTVNKSAMLNNYILSLNANFNQIKMKFSDDARQSIRKAELSGLIYQPGELDEAIDLYRMLYSSRMKVSINQFEQFRRLCIHFSKEDNVMVRKVADKFNNTLAAVIILKYKKRMYNIINATTDAGRRSVANYLLYSSIFREYESTGFVFDFEGSDIPGIASFYRKFGAHNEPYPLLHFNQLPWPIKLLKK